MAKITLDIEAQVIVTYDTELFEDVKDVLNEIENALVVDGVSVDVFSMGDVVRATDENGEEIELW